MRNLEFHPNPTLGVVKSRYAILHSITSLAGLIDLKILLKTRGWRLYVLDNVIFGQKILKL